MILWLVQPSPSLSEPNAEENGHLLGFSSTLTVGRKDDKSVSRSHAVFHMRTDGCLLRDLGSKFGTFVNGQRLSEQVELHDGDIVFFGACMTKTWRCIKINFTPFLDPLASLEQAPQSEKIESVERKEEATHYIYDESHVEPSETLAYALVRGMPLWSKTQFYEGTKGLWKPKRIIKVASDNDRLLRGHTIDLNSAKLSPHSQPFLIDLIQAMSGRVCQEHPSYNPNAALLELPVSITLDDFFLNLSCRKPFSSSFLRIIPPSVGNSSATAHQITEIAKVNTPMVNYKNFRKAHVRSRLPQIISTSDMRPSKGDPPAVKEKWLTPPSKPKVEAEMPICAARIEPPKTKRFKSSIFSSLQS